MTLIMDLWRRFRIHARGLITVYRIDRALREDLLLHQLGVEWVKSGARQYVKDLGGVRAFWVSRGGRIDGSSLRTHLLEVPRDEVGFHLYELDEKLPAAWEDIHQAAVAAVRGEIVRRCFLLLAAAHPDKEIAGPDDDYVRGVVNEAIRQVGVSAGDRDQILAGSPAAIATLAAHRVAALTITERDAEQRLAIADDRLFVFSPTAYRFVVWKRPRFQLFHENDQPYMHLIMRWEFGGVVHHPDRIRQVVKLTAPAPAKR